MKKLFFLAFCCFFSTSLYSQCWQTVSSGHAHTLAVKSDGTLWAWGFNAEAQLGDGSTADKSTPVQIGTASNWKIVSAGNNHSLAIKTDGTLWAWGSNFWGQVGIGSFGNQRNTPIQIGTATNWKSISAGLGFSAAIKTDGTLWTWGDNFYGQLGFSNPAFSPTQVGTATDWESVSAGGNHILAVRTDGTLWTSGYNGEGQLGDGTTTNKNTFTRIGTATNWKSVAAGYDFSLALQTDGTLWSWGNNDNGQLGDGSLAPKTSPAQVGSATNWRNIAAGYANSLAIRTTGTLWAWGYNIGGIVFGEDENKTTPTQLGTDSNWQSLDLGDYHAMAFQTSGTLWGWGDNTWGRLGNESWMDEPLPVLLFTAAPAGEASQLFCSSATVANLQASGSAIKWYAAASGGSPLPSNTVLVNGNHYYATQTLAGCEASSRLDVTVSINTTPTAAPTGTSLQIFCPGAQISNLTATGTDIKWYATATNGEALSNTYLLTGGSRYFASQTINGCESVTRLEVEARITDKPTGNDSQLFCTGSTVSNLAVTGAGIKWYSAEGVALPGSTLLVNGNDYYASQTINAVESCQRLRVIVTVYQIPGPPTGAATQTFCSSATLANLSATGSSIKWYSVASGGTALPATSNVSNGSHYYASQTTNVCESISRLDVTVFINSTSTSSPSGASAQLVCTGSTITALTASGTNVKWYSSNVGGTALPSTTVLVAGAHYFASQTINTCESAGRLDVVVSLAVNTTPKPVFAAPVKWKKIHTNEHFSAAIKADGTLWAWGVNRDWAFADGTTNGRREPGQIGTDNNWKTISGGMVHILAIKEDGSLWAWGYNENGQLGDGTYIHRKTPVQIEPGTKWKDASAGDYHSLALKEDGTLWSWGANYSGVLGYNSLSPTHKIVPVQVGTDNDWKIIETGDYHSLAIKNDGSLWAWGDVGYSYFEPADDGGPVDAMVPMQVGTCNDWESMSGNSHSLAIKKDGTLWTMGGFPGDGTRPSRNVPVQVGTDTDWKEAKAGEEHSLALKKDGTIWAWGWNSGYQLGDGTPPTNGPASNGYFYPTKMGTDSDWESISAGENHTLATKKNGSLYAWGYNGHGEVGDGTRNISSSPTLILSASQNFCANATLADLTVTGDGIQWYSTATGGTKLPPATVLTNGTRYYAVQTVNACESASRLLVTISVGSLTSAPSGASSQTFCAGSTVSDLQAQGSNVAWYASASGGAALPADHVLQNNVHYYASQTIGSCQSGGRLDVTVTLTANTTPAVSGSATQTFCAGANVKDLTVTGSAVQWYSAATGNLPLSPSTLLVNNAHYYATQTQSGCESVARFNVTVTSTPSPTGASVQPMCSGATVANLQAAGTVIKWYNSPYACSPLPASTPLLGDRYYYASQTLNSCESLTWLQVKVESTEPPAGPSRQTLCSGSTLENLTVTGTTVKWYNAAQGGSSLPASTLLVSGSRYYATQTLNGCESIARLDVTSLITTVEPAGGAEIQLMCAGSTLEYLNVSGQNIKWYDVPSGGNSLSPATALAEGDYYATQTMNSCESARHKITVQSTPAPTGILNQSFCAEAIIQDLKVSGNDVRWYTTASGGSPLVSSTPLVDGGHYYATQSLGFCESLARLEVISSINPIPLAPSGSSTQILESGQTISDLVVTGNNIKWYSAAHEAYLRINPLPSSHALISDMTYYATQTISGCESLESFPVTITIITSIEENEFKAIFYPNPVNDYLEITFGNGVESITLINSIGQSVLEKKVDSNRIQLDFTHMKSGIYFIKLQAKNGTSVHKVVKR